MKVTNTSNEKIYLKDLKFVPQAQTEGRRGEDVYIASGASVYLPDTSEVLRSAIKGDIFKLKTALKLSTNDTIALAANGSPGDDIVITHNFNYPPTVVVLQDNTTEWIDATGNYDVSHNLTFTTVTITNSTAGALTFLIRIF